MQWVTISRPRSIRKAPCQFNWKSWDRSTRSEVARTLLNLGILHSALENHQQAKDLSERAWYSQLYRSSFDPLPPPYVHSVLTHRCGIIDAPWVFSFLPSVTSTWPIEVKEMIRAKQQNILFLWRSEVNLPKLWSTLLGCTFLGYCSLQYTKNERTVERFA